MSPETMFILGLLSIAAMLLTTGFLLFSKGASDYKNPELTRDYHSSRDVMSERGKNAVYGRLHSGDE